MSTNWKTSDYTRGQIDRSGEILRAGSGQVDWSEFIHALSIMDNWRTSHAFPLNTIQMNLRKKANRVDSRAEVVQRLKRAQSVILKLNRYPSMMLSRMQDLGGCRAILSDLGNVASIQEELRKSSHRHKLANEKNYIEYPQESGYRGVHLIYLYQSDRNKDFNGHRIEIQLRTRVQHAWATAVEIAGVYVRTPLKSSIGPSEWLEFFKYCSSAFSELEGTARLHQDLTSRQVLTELRRIDAEIDARAKLRAFNAAHKYLEQTKIRSRETHFILILNLESQRTDIESFEEYRSATARYSELEKQYLENPLMDIVLVAAASIQAATSAYPNYFADTSAFLELLDGVLG
jgi:ppGpp synthetase/RelA/SpoT-type nucleotidyltranferase